METVAYAKMKGLDHIRKIYGYSKEDMFKAILFMENVVEDMQCVSSELDPEDREAYHREASALETIQEVREYGEKIIK